MMSKDFIVKVVVQLRNQFCILNKNKEICMALFHTDQNFFCIYITLCIILCITSACGSQVHGSTNTICHNDIYIAQWVNECDPLSTLDLTLRIFEVIKIVSYIQKQLVAI